MDKENYIKDMERKNEIERKLRNEKRPWFFRRYLGRNLMQWINLYLGLFIIIMTLSKKTPWDIGDLFLMVLAGVNIYAWVLGGILNNHEDFIYESFEMNRKILELVNGLTENIDNNRGKSNEYYEIRG